jgi:hypothetical protein
MFLMVLGQNSCFDKRSTILTLLVGLLSSCTELGKYQSPFLCFCVHFFSQESVMSLCIDTSSWKGQHYTPKCWAPREATSCDQPPLSSPISGPGPDRAVQACDVWPCTVKDSSVVLLPDIPHHKA